MISSQSQNPYVYCMNNPLRYIDPTGMMGDIPDWSLPDDYFNGYVSSVGTLINTVVNTATEFASGVNHGVAAGTTSTSGVSHPQTNGKIERFYGTLEQKLKHFKSIEEFMNFYNKKRPHMSLNLDVLETPEKAFYRKLESGSNLPDST